MLLTCRSDICESAAAQKANVVILSAGKYESNFLDSKVVNALLKSTTADVAVLVSHGDSVKKIKRVLVPVSNAGSHAASLHYATMMSNAPEISIRVVHLVDPGDIKKEEDVNYLTDLCGQNSTMKVSLSPPLSLPVPERLQHGPGGHDQGCHRRL